MEQSPLKKDSGKMQEPALVKNQMMGNNKLQIQSALGEELFNHVYDFLKYHRRKGTEESQIYSELKNMVGGNRQKMNHIFNLDGIVFMEMMQK